MTSNANALVLPGKSYPLGATVRPEGVNFVLFSKNSDHVELLLFDDVDDVVPARVIPLDRKLNRTFYYWHALIPGIGTGQLYGYRVYGPHKPEEGHRFDGWKVLVDPYARAVAFGSKYDRDAAIAPGDNCAYAARSVVVDTDGYDWEGDLPRKLPFGHTLIYEAHVAGMTRHPNSEVSPHLKGTYAGLIEKIPYLKSLGITAVELLPVQQFDDQDAPDDLTNYWGYSPFAWFAPHAQYSSDRTPLGPVNEFRDMVKAMHRAEIEVILDVVFNHTAEGDEHGPTMCFRGLENRGYYMLQKDRRKYANYTGCGNTVNANHSVVRRMILDCLRYWVTEMHVDGFRFDLASVLARDEQGHPLSNPPVLWSIESEPAMAGTKIIAEAWDAGGLYQVGSFVGHKWAEWNGPFRDDTRRFWRGDDNMVWVLSQRILGSPDLYNRPDKDPDRTPNRSINFITSHDGFTLNDLVSYSWKHNEANGENNRDGADANWSNNWGVEGPSNDPAIEGIRERMIRNLLATLVLSQGTPMLLMGDEVRRTQLGNNNAYSQNNEISWFNWENLEKHQGVLRFLRKLIRFTQTHQVFQQERWWKVNPKAGETGITWHGVRLGRPDWQFASHTLAFELQHPEAENHLHVMFNAWTEPLVFELPALYAGKHWHRVFDTSLPSPSDFNDLETAPEVNRDTYLVEPRSAVMLVLKP